MKILIIYDDTQNTLDFLELFAFNSDINLIECVYATSKESSEHFMCSTNFDQIIIAGQSVDFRDVEGSDFVPYNIIMELSKFDLSRTRLQLVSPDEDFLNKGQYLAQGKDLNIERHHIRNKLK